MRLGNRLLIKYRCLISYHQKVPLVAPDLEMKATYGLVQPEEYTKPAPSEAWTKQIYDSFDLTKAPTETVTIRASLVATNYF